MIFLLVLGALTAFVAAPLYRPGARAGAGDARAALEIRRDELITALRELEIDRRSGAVDEATYRDTRARTEAEAAEVLRTLDD